MTQDDLHLHTYYYDAENHLIQIDGTLGTCSTATACYVYDANGARVEKIAGGAATSYAYDGGKVVAEYTGGLAASAEYVYMGDQLLSTMGEAPNGSFEAGMSGWSSASGASVVTNATNAHSGSNYLQLSTSSSIQVLSDYLPVKAGEPVAFGGWGYRQSGSSGYVSWDVNFYDSSYTYISAATPTPSNVTGASWTYQVAMVTAPTGAAYVKLLNQVYLPTAAVVARFDDGFVSAGTQYYHQDHLGSTRLLTSANGADAGDLGYFPYGKLWYPSSPATKWEFTGKERDSESGLDNFGARYMSSQFGRFMTPDPVGIFAADASNPQSWNQYSYVLNNPLRFIDPTGLYTCVYLTDDGNDVENTDSNSSAQECSDTGGYEAVPDQNVTVNGNDSQYDPTDSPGGGLSNPSDPSGQFAPSLNPSSPATGMNRSNCVGAFAAGGAAVGAVGGGIVGGGGGFVVGAGGGTLVAPGVGTVGGGIVGTVSGADAGAATGTLVGATVGAAIGNVVCSQGSGGGGGGGGGASGSNDKKTADQIISEQKKACVRSRFPGQFLNKTLAQIRQAAQSGDDAAQTALKLLTDSRFNK